MKLLPFALAACVIGMASVPAYALTHKYHCDELIFDAVTKQGYKRIQLCLSGGKINYNFGEVNHESELDTLIPFKHAVLHTNKYSRELDPAVELFRGEYSYTIFSDVVIVSKGEIQLSQIPLERPIYNNLLEALLPTGVPITQRPFTFSYYIKDIENVTQHQSV